MPQEKMGKKVVDQKSQWKRTYHGCKQRCNNPRSPAYPRYGGRGIKFLISVDELKKLWFRDNAKAMRKPTIDRKDNDGNYCYENCRYIELYINAGRQKAERTHCSKGHPFVSPNVYIAEKSGKGFRRCRICDRATNRKSYHKAQSILKNKEKV